MLQQYHMTFIKNNPYHLDCFLFGLTKDYFAFILHNMI